MFVCMSIGFPCVLRLWTWGEVYSLSASPEEQFHGRVVPYTRHWQYSPCETNQIQLLVLHCLRFLKGGGAIPKCPNILEW